MTAHRISKLVVPALTASATVIAAAAIIWPTLALFLRVTDELGDGGPRPVILSPRQLLLLGKSMALCATAALVSLGLSVPAAMLLSGARDGARFVLIAIFSAVLLCPPMVYAFGWQRLVPAGIDGHLLCVFLWAAWAWPLAALILASGLRTHRTAYESALLQAGQIPAMLHVLLPAVRPFAFAALAAIFILFLGDYSVPHACGLIVYATETLGWAANSTRAIDTLAPALPGMAIVALGLAALAFLSRRVRPGPADRPIPAGAVPTVCTIALIAITWAVPLVALIWHLESIDAIFIAARTYAHDIAWTVLAAAAGGLCVCLLAIALAGLRRWQYAWAVWVILLGALPGALLGKALVTAYNRAAFGWFYDSWLIVSAGYVARFAWLSALVALLLARDLRSPLADQAAMDGAGRWSALLHIFLPTRLGLIAALVLIVVALSLGEAATTSLVRVPTFAPVSLVIIEKFHRLEDDMLISLSLLLVAVSLPAAASIAWAWREHD